MTVHFGLITAARDLPNKLKSSGILRVTTWKVGVHLQK